MKRLKHTVVTTVIAVSMALWPVCAQQRSGNPVAQSGKQASPPPKQFQLTQQDFNLIVNISQALAAGNQEQVKRIFTDSQLSIPQFERIVGAICDLSAERRFANSGGSPKSQTIGARPMVISNLPDARSQLAERINIEFDGRGRNYQDAKTLITRQLAAADDVCRLQTPRTSQTKR